jgi:hypothetical protein
MSLLVLKEEKKQEGTSIFEHESPIFVPTIEEVEQSMTTEYICESVTREEKKITIRVSVLMELDSTYKQWTGS